MKKLLMSMLILILLGCGEKKLVEDNVENTIVYETFDGKTVESISQSRGGAGNVVKVVFTDKTSVSFHSYKYPMEVK